MLAFLMLPIVRHILAGALLVAAIAAVGLGIYHAGRRDGVKAEASSQAETNHAQVEQIQKTFQAALSAGQAREDRLEAMAAQYAEIAKLAVVRVEAAQNASAIDAGKVKALPDSAIKGDLEWKAGGPLENPAVLRHVDDVFTDYPHKVDELKATNDEKAAIASRAATFESEAANISGQRDAAIAAFNALLPIYTQAYNAAIVGHRKWYCLFLCKPKKIAGLPDPVTLAGALKKH